MTLSEIAKPYDIILTPEMEKKFQIYFHFLLEYNQKVNLTAITEPSAIQIKHFLDSLLIFTAIPIEKQEKIIDVGTGAGFPGVPMKIYHSDLQLTLLDSLQKRLVFLEQLCDKLEMEKVELLHGRAEQVGRELDYREQYDLVVSRAVASLPALAEYCLPLAKVGGRFVAMKGPDVKEEIIQAEKGIGLLGGKIEEVKEFTLPDGSFRSFVIVKKERNTDEKYPRTGVKISKKPL